MNSDRLPDNKLETTALVALVALIGISRFSKLIENVDVTDIENLLKNEEFQFLGSLITKLAAVRTTNDYEVSII